jgi:hypothetical protein
MALAFKGFLKDQRGTTFEGIALSVSIIAVGFVASADMLDYITKSRAANPAMVAQRATPATIASNNLDETPTGTLPKLISRSVLDPCTGVVR